LESCPNEYCRDQYWRITENTVFHESRYPDPLRKGFVASVRRRNPESFRGIRFFYLSFTLFGVALFSWLFTKSWSAVAPTRRSRISIPLPAFSSPESISAASSDIS